jgi:hypothetical protein
MTKAEFLALYPEFATISDAKILSALSISTRLLSETAWDDFYQDAIGLDAAHNLAIGYKIGTSPDGGFKVPPGPLSSASAAGASVSFAVAPGDGLSKGDAWYSRTVYGQRFLQLRSSVMSPAFLAC